MGYRLREIEANRKFSQELKLEVIEDMVPLSTIKFEHLLCNLARKPCPCVVCAQIRVSSNAKCPNFGSNAQNTRSGLNRLCLSVSQSCLFEWSCL